jgi:nucleoid-associated protein YgaU
LAALGGILGGLPWALVRFGQWPITGVPTGEQLSNLRDSVVSDTAVFGVLTLSAWLVWALFLLSFLVEARAALHGLQAPTLTFAGPVQRSARLLVATVLVGLTIHHSSPHAVAVPATSARVDTTRLDVVGEVSRAMPPTAPPQESSSQTPAAVPVAITVGPGDSAWSLAEAHLGDGMRWRELWHLNRNIVQPDGRTWSDPQIVRTGWQLQVPGMPDREQSAAPTGEVHVVQRGDTLWDIAEDGLGDPHRYPEIFDLNVDDVQADGHRLEDPDLILPGWELDLPTDPPAETSLSTPSETSGAEPHRPAFPAEPTSEPTPPSQTQPPAPAPAPADSTPTEAPPTTLVSDGQPVSADRSPGSSSSAALATTLAGVTGALAVGLALRIALLRRRRSVRGARRSRALPQALAETESAVVAAADIPLVRWAGQELAQLIANLKRHRITGGPVAVEISEEAGIELLWETPAPDAPTPWQAADGGWAWRLPYDPEADVPASELSSGIPALVTIGERQGRQLLVDLEAYGAITVDGPTDHVDAFLRSLALELASDDELADAYVIDVGLGAAVEHLDRLTNAPPDAAAEALDRAAGSVKEALDATRVSNTFEARAGSTVPIEATVVVAESLDADDTRRIFDCCAARSGVAVVAAGSGGTAPCHIQISEDGMARLAPLDIAFSPVGVASETAQAIDQLFDALASEPDEEVCEGTEVVDLRQFAAPSPSSPSDNGHGSRGDHPSTPPNRSAADDEALAEPPSAELFPEPARDPANPQLLVRVLGRPTVPDRPDLGRRELVLTVYLACREGPVATSAVQDALWGGKPVETKTVWNVVGATRKALGDLADGTPVLPAADRSHGGTLEIAPGVSTDLALLRSLVERASRASSSEAIDLLRTALDLVNGPPFDAVGYDWAYRDQNVAEASALIEQATEQLVDLALDATQIDVAREAIVRGLRGLPGNEELYRCRMRVEHHAGNLPGVTAAYEELVTYLTDLETEPSPATTALYQDLVRPARRP